MKRINWWNSCCEKQTPSLWKPTLGVLPAVATVKGSCTFKEYLFPETTRQIDIQRPNTTKDEFKDELYITRKIKLNPTKDQRLELQKWYDGYRYTYNKTLESIVKDVGTESERIACDIEVNEDSSVSLKFGKCVEPTPKLFLKIDQVRYPKLKVKLNVSKKTGLVSMKIDIKEDPIAKPLKVHIAQGFPESRTWQEYRNELVTIKNNGFFDDKEWLKETPKVIRQCAVHDACAAYKSICTNAKLNGAKGRLREIFRKKKHQSWSFSAEKECGRVTTTTTSKSNKAVTGIQVCPSFLPSVIKCYESIPDNKISHDFKIHRDKRARFWLLLPMKCNVSQPYSNIRTACSLDNGVSKLTTVYSTKNQVLEVFPSVVTRQELDRLDNMQSILDGSTTLSITRRKYLKKKMADMRERIKNKVTNMHWHTINRLVDENDLVVMGKFNVQSILRSNTIAKYSKRILSLHEHYSFKTRLQYKCKRQGVFFRFHSEWGTTIGCPCCGVINRIPLSEREYHCAGCNYVAERDAKSACTIMLKYLAKAW